MTETVMNYLLLLLTAENYCDLWLWKICFSSLYFTGFKQNNTLLMRGKKQKANAKLLIKLSPNTLRYKIHTLKKMVLRTPWNEMENLGRERSTSSSDISVGNISASDKPFILLRTVWTETRRRGRKTIIDVVSSWKSANQFIILLCQTYTYLSYLSCT